MTLADGRTLAWYEYGDRAGVPCLFFAGAVTSGRAGTCLHEAAMTNQVRLISVDRPGLGQSDPAPTRPLVDWGRDVEQLIDHLDVGRFGVIGHSAGGAFALAVAHRLADRVSGTLIGAGSAPYGENWVRADGLMSRADRLYFGLALRAPDLFGRLYLLSAPRSARAVNRFAALASRGKSADAEFARSYPQLTRSAMEALVDGCRQGVSAPIDDTVVLCRPWGFTLQAVAGRVEWWHGKQDANVSLQSAREVTSRLPNARTHIVDGGHYVLFAHATEAIANLKAGG
jgi:pimeloyl-ACP methyl ester carboxylesterase